MTVPLYLNFDAAIKTASRCLKHAGEQVHAQRWQGMDVSKNPAASMIEYLFFSFGTPMRHETLIPYQDDIKPNLPWADDHFMERVGGEPLNPGEQWRHWPYSHSADQHRTEQVFNHTYMERFWPRWVGKGLPGGVMPGVDHRGVPKGPSGVLPHMGIRHPYGDLRNVVDLLSSEPDTRQAYLPVWFPEDTGDIHDGRKPCTLGYHFIMRQGKLHCSYYIRSCDFVRHFRDDIYLTVRLNLWLIDQCRQRNMGAWRDVKPGQFVMHITSLHCFINDPLTI